MITSLIIWCVIILLILFIVKSPIENIHSHWSQLIPNFKFSTMDFYKLLEEEMRNHKVEDLSFSEERIKTGNIFSSRRIYLSVKWKNFRYDMCFAPFGDGCFVSWWLIFETTSFEFFIGKIPLIGEFLRRAMYRITYYKIDTASMFMTYAHNSVLMVIDEITKETGIRLSEDERKPIMRDIFHR